MFHWNRSRISKDSIAIETDIHSPSCLCAMVWLDWNCSLRVAWTFKQLRCRTNDKITTHISYSCLARHLAVRIIPLQLVTTIMLYKLFHLCKGVNYSPKPSWFNSYETVHSRLDIMLVKTGYTTQCSILFIVLDSTEISPFVRIHYRVQEWQV